MAHGHSIPPAPLPLPGVSKIIAVGSGKGGVGKTTVAVNLAIALARTGHKVGLIDADIYGPKHSVDDGFERPSQSRAQQPDRAQLHSRRQDHLDRLHLARRQAHGHGADPCSTRSSASSCSRLNGANSITSSSTLPPGTGDVVISLVQTVPLTGAVVVSTPSDVALQDARKALEMFAQVNVEVLGIVENMSHFTCPHCSTIIDIFARGRSRAHRAAI